MFSNLLLISIRSTASAISEHNYRTLLEVSHVQSVGIVIVLCPVPRYVQVLTNRTTGSRTLRWLIHPLTWNTAQVAGRLTPRQGSDCIGRHQKQWQIHTGLNMATLQGIN